MDLDLQNASVKSHSGVGHDDEEHRGQNAANYHRKHKTKHKELDEDSLKESLIGNLRQEDSTHWDVGVSNNEICEDDNDCISTKSCCGDSTQKITQRRPTLRELLQLPADCGSPSGVMDQKEKQLENQKSVSVQYKWCGLLKTKGISRSSVLKLEDRENKKPHRKNESCVFGRVTSSAERTKLIKKSDHIG